MLDNVKVELGMVLYGPSMQLVEHYIGGLLKYAQFRGRASRAEYWWFNLANTIITCVFWLLGISVGGPISYLGLLYAIAAMVPNLSITVRRLHDTSRSGWWMLLSLFAPLGAEVPFVILVPVVFLFFLCQRGHSQENRYGPPVLDGSASG